MEQCASELPRRGTSSSQIRVVVVFVFLEAAFPHLTDSDFNRSGKTRNVLQLHPTSIGDSNLVSVVYERAVPLTSLLTPGMLTSLLVIPTQVGLWKS